MALEYLRALYAGDPARAYRLISTEDQRLKDEQTFLRQREGATGFAREVASQLASFIEGDTVEKTITGERARLTLKLRLPNANAPEVAALVHDWDERRLNGLWQPERQRIARTLDDLRRAGRLPMLEGQETLELVREASGWRVFLNWAGGVRIRFTATVKEAIPVTLDVSPEAALIAPGERLGVTVRAKNLSGRELVLRVRHRTEPKAHANSLALLRCPLFVPVSLDAGQSEEFVSEYLLLKDVPQEAKQFQVTYEFFPAKQEEGSGAKRR